MLEFLRRFADGIRKPKGKTRRLESSDAGLALFEDEREVYRFGWTEVSRIETYKRDLGTVDTICLEFLVTADRLVCATDDEMGGFAELCGRLTQHFPCIAPDWWSEVAFPAFATKHRILYEKSSA